MQGTRGIGEVTKGKLNREIIYLFFFKISGKEGVSGVQLNNEQMETWIHADLKKNISLHKTSPAQGQ